MLGIVGRIVEKHARLHPDSISALDAGKALTYRELNDRVNQAARFLASEGLRQGDNAGLMINNTAEFAVAFLALAKLGVAVNLWNFRLVSEDIKYMASLCGAKAVLYGEEFESTISPVRASGLGGLFVRIGEREPPPGVRNFSAEVRRFSSEEPPLCDLFPDDFSSVIYTSGTLGRPKGAAYTQSTQILSAIQYSLEMGLDRSHRGLTLAPLIHGGALNFWLAYLLVGGSFVFSGKYDPPTALRLCVEHQVTELMAVPTQIEGLLSVPELESYTLSSLRLIRTAGSRYPKSLVDRVRTRLGCEVLNTYGMTENCANTTAYHSALDPYEKRDSIGKATYFWEVRVIRVDPDRPVSPAEAISPPGIGQLIVRGPQNIAEYYRNPQEAAPIQDGWLYTRDIVEVDEDGYMYIVDRIDNVIITGAENVYPQEVEAFLLRHPGVADAAVFGVPDPTWGEVVMACVCPKSPGITREEIDRYCRESGSLAGYKRPRIIEIVDEIPKNVFGKTERKKLEKKYRALRSQSY